MQLVDLHGLSHDVGDSDCTICTLASEDQQDHFVAVALLSVPEEIVIPTRFQKKQYVSPFISSLENPSILNKAPPATT